jgi:hypothetical protein
VWQQAPLNLSMHWWYDTSRYKVMFTVLITWGYDNDGYHAGVAVDGLITESGPLTTLTSPDFPGAVREYGCRKQFSKNYFMTAVFWTVHLNMFITKQVLITTALRR